MAKKGYYIPSLDGIRAIAVMLVVVAHAGFARWVPGGFGVNIFFVLSGYLITSLLRREYERAQHINLVRFWVRRAMRILPPMYMVLGLAVLAGLSGFVAADIRWQPVVAQFLHLTNYYSILVGQEHFPPGTEIFWSLAVEEHYYLLYPPILLLLLRRRFSYRAIAAGLLAVSMIVLVWRCVLIFGFDVNRGYTFEATDTRIDSILFGCILGLWRNPHDDDFVSSPRRVAWGVVLGAALLLLTFVFRGRDFSESFRYTIRNAALLPIFFAAVRYHDWWIFRWLEWPWMRWGGRLSYTIYLIHPLAIDVTRQHIVDDRVFVLPVALALTLAFSLAMYHAVERHFARLRRRWH